MSHEATKFIEWTTPEFTYRSKSNDWYWGLGILAIVGFVASVLTQNFLTAVLVLLAAFLLVFFSRKKPDDVLFEMSDQGIRINDSLFPYQNLQSFWLGSNSHGEPLLFLHVDRKIIPMLMVPVHPDINLQEFREALLAYLPEVEHREPMAHILSDRLGF